MVHCGSVKIHSSEVFTTASNLGQKNDADGKKGLSVENQSTVQILIPNEHRSPSIAIMAGSMSVGFDPVQVDCFCGRLMLGLDGWGAVC